MEEKKVLYSTHIFILPFKILEKNDNKDKKKNDKDRRKELILSNEKDWKDYIPTEIIKQGKKASDNEVENNKNMLKYFTKYAKDSLFRYGEDENDNYVMELHNIKVNGQKFEIITSKKKYEMELESVRVKFFDTSVGTIAFTINNYSYPNIEDILLINNQGRKIYPAYEGEECPIIRISGNGFEDIEQNICKASINYIEGIEYIENKIIGYFLNLQKIEPILDDRMYTVCHYLDCNFNQLLNEDRKKIIEAKLKKYWYQYVFIDTSDFKTCRNEDLEEELLKKANYSRWRDMNTYFGVSRYSFMLWTDTTWFPVNILNTHIKLLYFQLINFIIAQKSTIILLNERINSILENGDGDEGKKEYQEYLTYLAKMSFKEITCQEQGIELYNLCRQQMEIESLTEELDLKIKTLNERAERIRDERELENDKKLNKKLNDIGIILGVLGVFFGVLGIGEEYAKNNCNQLNIYGYLIEILKNYSLFSIIFILGVIFILMNRKKK